MGVSHQNQSAGGHDTSPPPLVAITTLIAWSFFYIFGHVRDFFRGILESHKSKGVPLEYAPIRQDYEDFYTRRMYYRLHDCFNRPICSAPDAHIDIMLRTPVHGQKPLEVTGEVRRCLNLGSYNYLGFANQDPYCTPLVLEALEQYGWAACSSRADVGTTPVHTALEEELAAFLGKPAALTYGMGFATNSLGLPMLVGKGSLIISDALNHASIVAGARGSGAKVKVSKHNDAVSLEQVLRQSISEGQPRTHRPWKKIMVVVEGVYSMEGELCDLAAIVAVCRKYKAYVYLDEAHSIGALGATGRGVCEATGVDPAHIDIMMGTFTKSFGSCGGYLAASKEVIDSLKANGAAQLYAGAMSPPATMQVLAALRLIQNKDGSGRGPEKLKALRENSNYFRAALLRMGCTVLGDWDSPVMPIMLYHPGKIAAFGQRTLERGIAAVVVGFPATPLLTSRARICISASHTKADLDRAIAALDEVADECAIKYSAPQKDCRAPVAQLESKWLQQTHGFVNNITHNHGPHVVS